MLFNLIGQLTVAILFAILQGFVLYMLWGWFVAPAFSIPELTLVYAMGIMLVGRCFLGSLILKPEPKNDKTYREQIITAVVFNVVLLGLGYVLTFFI